MTPLNLEKIYDDFEAAWNQQERPKIEEFLRDVEPNVQRVAIRELFAIELERRLSLGEMPELKDYLGRFTDFHSELRIAYREVMSQPEQGSNETLRIPRTTRFEPLERLGKGGQGEVWLSLDPNMGRRVALKILQPGRQGSEPSLSWFKRESEISGKLEHPNIVPVYDVSNELDQEGKVDPESPCFIMRVFGDQRLHAAVEAFHARARTRSEYPLLAALRDFESERTPTHEQRLKDLLGQFHFDPDNAQDQTLKSSIESILSEPSEAGTLEGAINRLHREGFSDSGLRKLLGRFQRICDGMAYAHSRGVIHRDLKPSNVMLGEYGETLIADWGLAKVIGRSEATRSLNTEGTLKIPSSHGQGELSSQGEVKGTLGWMPPEQASGLLDELGPTSDIYSLGAILYQILTGTAPHKKSDLKSIRRNEFPALLTLNPRTPKALEAITLKAMATQAEDRYQTASALSSDIERWLSDEPVTAWHEPLTVRLKRWVRTHQTAAAAAIASLTMATIAALGWGAITSQHAADLRKERDKTKLAKELADDARILADDKAASEQRAKEKAELEEKNATEQKLRAQRLLVGISEENIARAMDSQDYSEALSWSVLALKQLQDTPDREKREPIFRQRIGALLDEFPYLAHLLPLDGELIHAELVGDPQFLVTATIRDDELMIRRWDVETGLPIDKYISIDSNLKSSITIRLNKDGTILGIAYANPTAKTETNLEFNLRVYDMKTCKQLGKTIEISGYIDTYSQPRLNANAKTFELDPSGKYLTCVKSRDSFLESIRGESQQYVQIWDIENLKKPLAEIGGYKNIHTIALDEEAKILAIMSDRKYLTLWDRINGKDITPAELKELINNEGAPTANICISNDGKTIAIPIDSKVIVCDLGNPKRRNVIESGRRIRTVKLSDESDFLIITSQDGQSILNTNIQTIGQGHAEVWDLKTNKLATPEIKHKEQVLSADWYPNFSMLITGGADGTVALRRGLYEISPLPKFKHNSSIKIAEITKEGKFLIIGSNDGLVKIWDLDRRIDKTQRKKMGVQIKASFDPLYDEKSWDEKGGVPEETSGWDGIAKTHEPLCVSSDGRYLLTKKRKNDQENQTVYIWDIETQLIRKSIEAESRVDYAQFTPDNESLILVHGKTDPKDPRDIQGLENKDNAYGIKKSTLFFFSLSGDLIGTTVVDGIVNCLLMTPDSRNLLIARTNNDTKKSAIELLNVDSPSQVIGSFVLDSPARNIQSDQSGRKIIVHLKNLDCLALVLKENNLSQTCYLPKISTACTAIDQTGSLIALGEIQGDISVFPFTDTVTSAMKVKPLWIIKNDPYSQSMVAGLGFTDDGTCLVSAREDGTIYQNLARNGAEITAPIRVPYDIRQLIVSKRLRRFLVAGIEPGFQLFESEQRLPITKYIRFGDLNVESIMERNRILYPDDLRHLFFFGDNKGITFYSDGSVYSPYDIHCLQKLANTMDSTPRQVEGFLNDALEEVDDPIYSKQGILFSLLSDLALSSPGNSNVQLFLGNYKFRANRFEEAISRFDEYLRGVTEYPDLSCLRNRGKAHEKLGNLDQAKLDFGAVAEISVSNMELSIAVNQVSELLRFDAMKAIDLLLKLRARIKDERARGNIRGFELESFLFKLDLVEINALGLAGRYSDAIQVCQAFIRKPYFRIFADSSPALRVKVDSFLARLYHLNGEVNLFEDICMSMLKEIDGSSKELYQNELADLLVDHNVPISDLRVLIDGMEKRIPDNQNGEFLCLLGGVQFRAGLYDRCLKNLKDALRYIRETPRPELGRVTEARILLLISLTHVAQGNLVEANSSLGAALPIYTKELSDIEPIKLFLRKPVLRRLHKELTEAMGASTKPNY